MTFTVAPSCSTDPRDFQSRSDAEDAQDQHIALCDDCSNEDDCPVVSGQATADGGSEVVEPEPMSEDGKPRETRATNPEKYDNDIPDDPSIEDDPVDWLPQHFIDTIQGVPTVNRKGYAVIASKYNVSVTADPVTLASETDFEYAEFRAVATTESGEEYSGFGSAHVDRMDGDDQYLLNELAETRALKRATAWATGVGLTAIEELKGEL